jgi:type I restriction enzyme R subunit
MESKVIQRAKKLLVNSGWTKEDILDEQSISLANRVYRPDIILIYNFNPLAVIETKSGEFSVEDSVQQTFEYLESLKIPIGFVVNDSEIYQFSRSNLEYRKIQVFPSPKELWQSVYHDTDNTDPTNIAPINLQRAPRFFQVEAVNRIVSAIKSGQKRLLIQMATGTGKTYVILQSLWKLVKSGRVSRVLYLDDSLAALEEVKHILKPLGLELVSLNSKTQANELLHSSVQFGTFHYFLEPQNSPRIKNYPRDYFDLVIINEVIRYPKLDQIIDHFETATILGFSSLEVFNTKSYQQLGSPVFSYTLEDTLVTEKIETPSDYLSFELDSIAEIIVGVSPKLASISEEKNSVSIISAKSLLPDGNIDFSIAQPTQLQLTGKFEKYVLKPKDILLQTFASGAKIRISILPDKVDGTFVFAQSIIRIRVNSTKTSPEEVFSFLRSSTGQLLIRRYTVSGSTIPHISVQSLRNLPIYLPKPGKSAPETELSSAARAKSQIEDVILPKLKKLQASNSKNETEQEEIARRLQQIASELAPPKLHERVVAFYPTPIAMPYRRFIDAKFNVYEQVLRLRDVYESIVHFLYNVMLADAFHRLDAKKYFVQDAGARRAYNGFSMSSRLDFIKTILELAKDNSGNDLFISELINTSILDSAYQLQDDFRNKISHTATATESQQINLIKTYQPVVDAILSDLDFLANYRMVRIPSLHNKHGNLYYRMEVYIGVVPDMLEEPLTDEKITKIDSEHLAILDADNNALDLYPMYQRLASDETHHETHVCFFKQRKAKSLLLEGESVQGAFPVNLNGYDEFELFQKKILDKMPDEP